MSGNLDQIQVGKKMKKVNKNKENVSKGEVYWFDPLKETKVDVSPLVVVLSGEIHNKFSSFVIFNLAGTKNTETAREFFEVISEVEGKKIKIMVSSIHVINKEIFLEEAKYLGKIDKDTIKKISEKVKIILELENLILQIVLNSLKG